MFDPYGDRFLCRLVRAVQEGIPTGFKLNKDPAATGNPEGVELELPLPSIGNENI